MDLTIISKIAVYSIPIIFAITVHEAAHGYAAKYFGDMTAFHLNRISLNPIRHIDPLGTIAFPILLVILQVGFIFGWAKPVPINRSNLRNPKKDMLWVALAGPGANLIMAIFWTIIYANQLSFPNMAQDFIGVMAVVGIQINIVLMVLNLLPLPALDGGKVLASLLPYPWSIKFASLDRYGIIILIFLMATGLLWAIMSPLIKISESFILAIFG